MLHVKAVNRVNPKSSHHKENFLFLFKKFFSLYDDGFH